MELAAFKQKATNILQTFGVNPLETESSTSSTSWLQKHTVHISIRNISVAFPLSLDPNLLSSRRGREAAPVRAFLFIIRSMDFGSEQGHSGEATVKGLEFLFTPR